MNQFNKNLVQRTIFPKIIKHQTTGHLYIKIGFPTIEPFQTWQIIRCGLLAT